MSCGRNGIKLGRRRTCFFVLACASFDLWRFPQVSGEENPINIRTSVTAISINPIASTVSDEQILKTQLQHKTSN